jgi:hypothetical protein
MLSDKTLDDSEKNKLNSEYNAAFRDGLEGYMRDQKKAETLSDFKTSLSNFLSDYSVENKENDDAYKSLMALADIM